MSSRKITILGGGQAGLQLGLRPPAKGYEVESGAEPHGRSTFAPAR